MTTPNPWLDFLEAEPKAAYYAYGPSFGKSPNQQSYFKNAFDQIYNSYLGQLGGQVLGGQEPTALWSDYLQGFDFGNFWQGLTPSQKGYQTGNFAPFLQWLGF